LYNQIHDLTRLVTTNYQGVLVRLLGIPETYSKKGYVIVKPLVKNVLECLGSLVFNDSGRRVGVVTDIIGRVDDPRVVVKLDDRDLGEFLVSRRERLYFTKKAKREKR
jgi:RNA-binding protein